jgi:hypothetical protein
VICELDDEEMQVDGMDLCQGNMVVVDARYTQISYYGGKFLAEGNK